MAAAKSRSWIHADFRIDPNGHAHAYRHGVHASAPSALSFDHFLVDAHQQMQMRMSRREWSVRADEYHSDLMSTLGRSGHLA
jgi:hypothetical protein